MPTWGQGPAAKELTVQSRPSQPGCHDTLGGLEIPSRVPHNTSAVREADRMYKINPETEKASQH